LGEHRGIPFHAIGQRKGLGLSGKEALYVTEVSAEENAVIVGRKEEVYGGELICSRLNRVAVDVLPPGLEAKVIPGRTSPSRDNALQDPEG
jgi:tRNA-specific 2-thiouridylase